MTSPNFTAQEIKKLALDSGADLVGVVGADTLNAFPPDPRWPQTPGRITPDAKSVIVMALRVPAGAYRTKEPEPYHMVNMMTTRRLDKVAQRMSTTLERRGYFGLLLNNITTDWELKSGTYGHLSLRHLAVEAGLGTLGLGVNFMCPEYGPRVNLTAVVTDCELAADQPMTEQLCIGEGCSRCLYACPTDSVLHFNIDKRGCSTEAQVTGIYGVTALFAKFLKLDRAGKEAVLKSPDLFNYFQGLTRTFGCFGTCPRCMAVCPVGNDYQEFLADPHKDIPEMTPERIEKGKTYKAARKSGEEVPGVSDWNIRWVGPDGYTGKAAKAERSRYKAAKVAETAQENTHK
ncbi:MAG: hypothetical protein CMJ96_07135 [Planctomycetes bacterium]|nr:hypothetical protein [Planctomycetota bacterium]